MSSCRTGPKSPRGTLNLNKGGKLQCVMDRGVHMQLCICMSGHDTPTEMLMWRYWYWKPCWSSMVLLISRHQSHSALCLCGMFTTVCLPCWLCVQVVDVYRCDLIELDSVCSERQSRKGDMTRRDEQRLAKRPGGLIITRTSVQTRIMEQYLVFYFRLIVRME